MTAATCIRREHSVWTTCPCDTCRRDRSKRKKLRDAGLLPKRVTSDEAWAEIDRLINRGWTAHAIASAAGLRVRCIEGALKDWRATGHRQAFGPKVAAAIVNHGEPTVGYVGATGARRRLQALAVMGWGLREVAEVSGVPQTSLSVVRSGHVARLKPDAARAIARAFNEMQMRFGPSVERNGAKWFAGRHGWVGPLAWDDIDDPEEQPRGVRPAKASYDRADLLAESDELLAEGYPLDVVAARLGVTPDAIYVARARTRRAS